MLCFQQGLYSLLAENIFMFFRVLFLSAGILLFVCLDPFPPSAPQFSFSVSFVYVELLPAQLQQSSALAARLVLCQSTTSAA